MQPLALFGPLGAVDPWLEEILLVLALANVVTRRLAHTRYEQQAEEGGDEAMSRFLPHEATNWLLVLVSFYLVFVHYHAGFVMSMLTLGLLVTDFFEFEARQVEVRNDLTFEAPKAAMVTSALVIGYAAFQALFYLVEGYWQAVVS